MKKTRTLLLLGVIILLLSGCAIKYGDGLLSLPKLPDEYIRLQSELDGILAEGEVYVSAESGADRQSVQLIDIDGDGADEAIALFRNPEGVYRVHVFKSIGEGYTEIGVADGYGRTLHEVSYPQYSSDGRRAIALSWGFEDGMTFGMTAHGFDDNGKMVQMLDIQYMSYLAQDIDNDGAQELAFVVRDNTQATYTAKFFKARNTEYKQTFEATVCADVKSVAKMQFGKTIDKEQALFIDSVASYGGYITDIICLNGSTAVNDTIDHATGLGSATWRPMSVFSTDIDGDGIIEVPVGKNDESHGGARGKLDFCTFKSSTVQKVVATTYHDVADEWYIKWPEKWDDSVKTVKTTSNISSKVVFYIEQPAAPPLPTDEGEGVILPGEASAMDTNTLLSIYCFTGEYRAEYVMMYKNLKVIKATASSIYAYSLPENAYPQYILSDEELREIFNTIDRTWSTEVK